MSEDSLASLNSATGAAANGQGGGHQGQHPPGHDPDDLNDLMEVFFDFDVVDPNEAQALERALGKDQTASAGLPSRKPLIGSPVHVVYPAAPLPSTSLTAAAAAGTAATTPTSASSIGTPTAMDVDAGNHSKLAVNASSAASSTSSSPVPGVVKSKRGRKKKEEILAMAAAAAAAGIPMPSPPMGASKDAAQSGIEDEERERLRRENNKQSARNSRKKKKEYVLVLSESIASLTKEVQQLRENLAKKAAEEARQEKLACIGRNAFLQAVQQHGPTAPQRRISATYQFENLTRNVAPPHTRFLLWSVARKATEADSAASRTWQEVSNVIGLQPEQQDRFAVLMRSKKATDHAAAEERDRLQFVFNTVQKLRLGMDQSSASISRYQTTLLDVLSPVQQALLFQWIEETHAEQNAIGTAKSFAFSGEGLSPEMLRARQVVNAPIPPTSRSVPQPDEANMVDFLLSLK